MQTRSSKEFPAWKDCPKCGAAYVDTCCRERAAQAPRLWSAWKDGEMAYLRGLVRWQGDANVPRSSVESYLRVQAASAKRDGMHLLSMQIRGAASAVEAGDWSWALCLLECDGVS